MALTHYSIHYTSSTDKPWMASINCYDQGAGEAGGSRIATIRFYDNSAAVPASANVGGLPVVNFSMARFDEVVGILRSEDDVSVNTFSGGPDSETSWGITSFGAAGGLREV